MIIQRAPLVLCTNQAADKIIPFAALCAALCHHNLDSIIKRHNRFHGGFLGRCGLGRINLRTGKNGQRPRSILLDLFRLVIRKTDKRVDHPDRKVQSKVHQVCTFLPSHRLKKFFTYNLVDTFFLPAVNRIRHKHWL